MLFCELFYVSFVLVSWKCDKIICPSNTYRCVVSKHKETPDATILKRINMCYDISSNVVSGKTFMEPIEADANVETSITAYRHGSTMQSAYNGVMEASANLHTSSVDSLNAFYRTVSDMFGSLSNIHPIPVPPIYIPQMEITNFPRNDYYYLNSPLN